MQRDGTNRRIGRRKIGLRALTAAALVALVALLAACGGSSSSTSSGGAKPAASKGDIAVELPFQGLDIYAPTMAGIRAEAKVRGYNVLQGFAGGDVDKAITELTTWITQGVRGIVVLALQTNSFKPLVARAEKQGTKVVAWVNPVAGSSGTLLLDPKQAGAVVGNDAAKWIHDHLHGRAQIVLMPDLQDPGTVTRVNAALAIIKKTNPGVTVVSTQSAPLGTPDQGLQITRNVLQAHPGANVFIPVNDSVALGIDKALQEAGSNLADDYVTGFDGSKAALERMLTGKTAIKSVAAANLVEAGTQAIDLTANAIEGKQPTMATALEYLVTVDDKAAIRKFLAQYK